MKLMTLLAVLIASVATPVYAIPASLTRSTRAVTDAEIAGGAPVGGFVHDFFFTSPSDLLIVVADVDVPLFQHTLGSDVAAPWGETAHVPGITADSFITLPSGETSTIGGFAFDGTEHSWYDIPNTGAQQDFHFARLTTTGQTGTFSGQIFIRNGEGNAPVWFPYSFALPGVEADLGQLASEPAFVYEENGVREDPANPAPPAPAPGPIHPPSLPPAPVDAPISPPQPPSEGPGGLAQVSLARHTRAVTAEEIAGGVPAGGFVHEFFATSDTDLLVIGDVEVTAPLYQHTLGSDVAAATPESAALDPALAADSFISLPGATQSVGGGLAGGPGDQAWFDVSNDGAQADFLFARLTTAGETGTFTGNINVRTYDGFASLPFDFILPGTEADLSLLASEALPSLEHSLDPPPQPIAPPAGPVPQPIPIEPAPIAPAELGLAVIEEPATIPVEPPTPWEGEPPADPPVVVVIPTEPVVPTELIIDEMIGDPTLIDIDLPYWPIRIGYNPPAFHEYFELIWNGQAIDVTLVDGDYLAIRPLIAYDGGFQTTSIYSPVEAYLFGMSTGAGTAWNVSQALGAADGGGSARVPEPATALLTLVAAIALATAARRGR